VHSSLRAKPARQRVDRLMGSWIGKGPHFAAIGVKRPPLDVQEPADPDIEAPHSVLDGISNDPICITGHSAIVRKRCHHRLVDKTVADVQIANPMGIDNRRAAALAKRFRGVDQLQEIDRIRPIVEEPRMSGSRPQEFWPQGTPLRCGSPRLPDTPRCPVRKNT
jgi:hypothetical protein